MRQTTKALVLAALAASLVFANAFADKSAEGDNKKSYEKWEQEKKSSEEEKKKAKNAWKESR